MLLGLAVAISARLWVKSKSSAGLSFGNCNTSAQYTALTTAAGWDTGNEAASFA